MRLPIRRCLAAGVLVASIGLNACVSVAPQRASGPVHHVVLCWLKTPGDAAQRQQLLEASRGLAKIPYINSVDAGLPVSSDRPIVDDSFDVAIHMTFENIASLQAYEADPRHVMAVQTVLAPLTSKVLIYDFME